MRYPFKVIVKGKLYGEASTLAEAQKVAKDRGGYVACECHRASNPTDREVIAGAVNKLLGAKEEARQSFIAYCVEHAGLTPEEAAAVGAKYKKGKAIDFRTDGRFYVTHGGLLEPELLRFHAGWATDHARVANPDLLTGKIRQREDGGHYVRTRKDKRPAEVDVTADQVAGDWRTQLAHSGHAPTPKPPKAPKGRAPKAGKPKAPAPAPMPATQVTDKDFYALGDRQVSDLVQVLWLELRTKRDAIGFCAALCEDVNFSGPKLPTPDFRDTTPDVSEVAKQLDWDIGRVGVFCWSLLTQYNAREEADEVKRATKQEMQESSDAEPPRPRPRQPRPEVGQSQSFQLAAARYPKLSQKRLKLLAMAIDLGASDAAIAVFAAAKTVAPNSATVIVPFGRYATETRNDGFARTRTKPNYRYAEKGPSGWILDNKSPYYSFADWEVVSKGPHDQETREMYHVGQYNVGGSPWTYAMLDK